MPLPHTFKCQGAGYFTSGIADDIPLKHLNGSLSKENFMYHGISKFGKEIEGTQLSGGSNRIREQQNDPYNATSTKKEGKWVFTHKSGNTVTIPPE